MSANHHWWHDSSSPAGHGQHVLPQEYVQQTLGATAQISSPLHQVQLNTGFGAARQTHAASSWSPPPYESLELGHFPPRHQVTAPGNAHNMPSPLSVFHPVAQEIPPLYSGSQGGNLGSPYETRDRHEHEEGESNKEERTLEVRGFNCTTQEETICMFFESEKRSGGGEIESCYVDHDHMVITLVFKTKKVAERVLKRQDLILAGASLEISKPVPKTLGNVHKCNTVMVTGVKPEMSDETLVMFFEQEKRNGGGQIKEMKRDFAKNCIYISFDDVTVASRVVDRGTFTLEGKELKAVWRENEEDTSGIETTQVSATIEVHGIRAETSDEIIEMFFENMKRSGGGDIQRLERNMEKGIVWITFCDPSVASRVLGKRDILFEGAQLQVCLPQPQKKEELSHIIEVHGVKPDTSTDTTEMFFENERKSGGGDIEHIERDTSTGIIKITYADSKIANRVLTRENLTLEGAPIRVCRPQPDKTDDTAGNIMQEDSMVFNAIVVHGIHQTTSDDTIELFFENKRKSGGGEIAELERNPLTGDVTITFVDPEVADRVLERGRLKLEGATLTVCRLTPPEPVRSVEIHGFHQNTSDDSLEMVFESKKRSGGGEIEDINIDRASGVAVITYKDHEVAARVIQHGESPGTTLDGVRLHVEWPHEKSALSAKGGTRSEDNQLETPKLDTIRVRGFHQESTTESLSLFFENRKRSGGGPVQNITMNEDKTEVLIKFLDPEAVSRILQKWEQTGLTLDNSRLDIAAVQPPPPVTYDSQVCFKKVGVNVTTDLLENFIEAKTSYIVENITFGAIPGTVLVALSEPVTENQSCAIQVMGEAAIAKEMIQKITQVQKQLDGQMRRDALVVKEKKTLQQFELRYLLAIQYTNIARQMFPDMKISINQEDALLNVTGMSDDVGKVMIDVCERVNALRHQTLKLPQASMLLMRTRECREHLVGLFSREGLVAVWVVENDEISVHATKQDEITHACQIIEQNIIETPVMIKNGSQGILSTEEWHSTVDRQERLYPGLCKIVPKEDNSSVTIVALKYVSDIVFKTVKDFINFNTVVEEFLKMERGKVKFLVERRSVILRAIEEENAENKVKLVWRKSGNTTGFLVHGNQTGIITTTQKLCDLSREIESEIREINKPGMPNFILSQRGKYSLENVEATFDCAIDVQSSAKATEVDDSPDVGQKVVAQIRTPENCVVAIHRDDLTKQRVDVIVNAANRDMIHIKGLAKAIVDAGGQSIQDECSAYTRKCGALLDGQVFASSAGKLLCQTIVHAVSPIWRGGSSNEETLLYEAVYNSLEKATTMKFKSISFPVFSAGVYRYPIDKCSEVILEAIRDFLKNSSTSVTEVRIVSLEERILMACQRALHGIFQTGSPRAEEGASCYDTTSCRALFGSSGYGSRTNKTTRETPSLMLTVYGDKKVKIDKAAREIDMLCEAESKEIVFQGQRYETALELLSKEDVKEIKSLEGEYDVKITVELRPHLKRIRIQCSSEDIIAVTEDINSVFREVLLADSKKRQAAMLAKTVQWSCLDIDDNGKENLQPFPDNINATIEDAHSSGKTFVNFIDENNDECQIDFSRMKEICLMDKTETDVKRLDFTKREIDLPSTWTTVPKDTSYISVDLKPSDQEYKSVDQLLRQTIGGALKQIIKVQRIQNPSMFQKYSVQKAHMEATVKAGTIVERVLWHGTSEDTLPSINRYGFNRSYCGKNATVFGKGVYFAVNASYGAQNTFARPNANGYKHLYLCRVLTGEYVKGKHDLIVPPQKDPNDKYSLYDSVVDNPSAPTMFVIFSDTQAYPKFLVVFQ